MNFKLLTFSLAICALASSTLARDIDLADPSDEKLKVMLQGSSSAEMRNLVLQNGGHITHYLPIINGVGALLSQPALDEILKSPLVERYLDDLSIADRPKSEPSEPDAQCDVGGALELELVKNGLNWRLYNKQEQAADLEKLSLTWPKSLGALTSLQLGEQSLAIPKSGQQETGGLVLEFKTGTAPAINGNQILKARFKARVAPRGLRQRDFTIELKFAKDCSTALVPAYDNNYHNTYYPSVVGASRLHSHGVTGKGVTVAIIDSGVWEHKDLTHNTKGVNRLIAKYDAINDTLGETAFDESGHGTHMTSVLAHSGPVMEDGKETGSFKGVAPDVNLVVVKAFDVGGQGDFLDIARAIQFVVDYREIYNIQVLNLSFAARPRWLYWQDPINQAVMRAWAAGITVVAAAGNEGPEPMTIGSPGNLPYVITVGAVTDSWTADTRNDDYLPDFSSRGPTPDAHIKPDLVAPGGHMTGLTRPGSTLAEEHPEYYLKNGDFVMTGSSQASALVSGVVALLLQLEPDLSPDDVKCKLMSSAEPAINLDGLLSYSPFEQGSGYVSATRAITLGETGCGNEGLDIDRDMNGEQHFQGPAIVTEDGKTSLPGLDTMVSPELPKQGSSATRRWGAKNHIEHPNYQWDTRNEKQDAPFDWEAVYLQEKARIEQLSEDSPD
ncbi:MAG: S8 family peptidase [Halioglobus sp.]